MIKPSVFFVLILCISGYQLLNSWHRYHYELRRSSGYHTFLKSATAGLVLFSAISLLYLLSGLLAEQYGLSVTIGEWALNKVFPSTDFDATEGTLFEVAIWMIIVSYFFQKLMYATDDDRNKLFMGKFANDPESPEYTRLFFRSLEFGLPILFTMSDRKVYIGYVVEVHAKEFNDIDILPIFSGYRDKDELTLKQVTPYKDVLDDLENEAEEQVDFERFTVTLPIREINYAHLHDFHYYEKFKEKEKQYKKSEDEKQAEIDIDAL